MSVDVLTSPCPVSGFATETIPQGAPLPTEHPKITIVHGIVFWEYGCGLLSMGRQSIGKLCRMSGYSLFQNAELLG